MRLFKNLGLLQKFALVGGTCVVLLCLSLIASVYGIKEMTSRFATFVDRDQAIAMALQDMYT